MNGKAEKQKAVIGRNVRINFDDYATGVPAKVDTGADSSSVWATDIRVDENGVLKFCLFGENSPHYTGEVCERTDFSVAQVRSSSGHRQVRYRTSFTIVIKGRRIKAMFNLSNRANNVFPVLIGRRTIAGKFLVDVQQYDIKPKDAVTTTQRLRDELLQDPHAFYKKYHQQGVES